MFNGLPIEIQDFSQDHSHHGSKKRKQTPTWRQAKIKSSRKKKFKGFGREAKKRILEKMVRQSRKKKMLV
jgi:hypothetical protein